MKLCTDCHWHRSRSGAVGRNHFCTHPQTWGEKSLVDGSRVTQVLCESARDVLTLCGPDGRYWQQKEAARPWWRFWR